MSASSWQFSVSDPDFPGGQIGADFKYMLDSWGDCPRGRRRWSINDLRLVFSITVENTSTLDSNLTAIGVNTDPNAERATSNSSIFTNVLLGRRNWMYACRPTPIPVALGTLEPRVCVSARSRSHVSTLTVFRRPAHLHPSSWVRSFPTDTGRFFRALPERRRIMGQGSAKAFGQPEVFVNPTGDTPVPEPASHHAARRRPARRGCPAVADTRQPVIGRQRSISERGRCEATPSHVRPRFTYFSRHPAESP